MKHLFFILIFLASSVFASEARIDQRALQRFVNAQQTLQMELELLCAGSEAEPTPALQETLISWFTVQALQLPAAEFMQTEYIHVFWPDPKDRLKKQVRAAVSQSPSAVNWNDLPASAKSLSAIEFLLTQPQPTDYCEWFRAISQYQIQQAKQLQSLQAFYDFGEAERLTALHGTALTQHMILKEVLSRPGKTLWILGPGWRSDSGVAIVQALVDQSSELLQSFQADHKNATVWQTKPENFVALSSTASTEELQQWNDYGEKLADFVEQELAPALNIFIGFNNFDGD